MFGAPAKVVLAAGATDMRRSIDGLSLIVAQVLQQDPLSEHWFAFCNRGRDKIKLLHYDRNGFWLHYKRLERGRFRWPDASPHAETVMGRRELSWLLEGLDLGQPQAFKAVSARLVA
ncbi:MAG: IS66 family insertion sequence element accessory protein TnpB [Opitutae bacterium]|nr:IS66 family insertion sequence element accessory protein TnpB [Opitutae bacterium]